MANDKAVNTTQSNTGPMSVTNIKIFVPLTLDLDELNYDSWRELFETHCVTFGLLGHLDGTDKPTGPDDKEWTQLDGYVKLWIYGTLAKPLLKSVVKRRYNAHELWAYIENLFRDNKDSRAIELENQLRNIRLGDLSINDYCCKIQTIADLLENINAPVPAKTLITYLIDGLPDRFSNIAGIILHRETLPTFLQARSMLLLEEQRMNRTRNPQASHVDNSSSPNILHVDTQSQPIRNRSSQNNRNRSNIGRNATRGNTNPHHSNTGNSWSNGFAPWAGYGWGFTPPWAYPNQSYYRQWQPQPNRSGRAQNNRRGSGNNGVGVLGSGLSHEQQQAFATSPSNYPTPPPWRWFSSGDSGQATSLPQAFNSMSLQDPNDNGWYMDTGATSHLASDTGLQDQKNPPAM